MHSFPGNRHLDTVDPRNVVAGKRFIFLRDAKTRLNQKLLNNPGAFFRLMSFPSAPHNQRKPPAH
jgi:hypothetical protein